MSETKRRVRLSTQVVDFEQALATFNRAILDADFEPQTGWNTIITGGVGTTLAEIVASAAVFCKQATIQATRESFASTAALSSSIIANLSSSMHILRKIPASVDVTLYNPDARYVFIPSYTVFDVAGKQFFNRESYIVNPQDAEVNITIHEGVLAREDVISSGGDNQTYFLRPLNFYMSDIDLFAIINYDEKMKYRKSNFGPWTFAENELVFYENTLSDGGVKVLFGNNDFGRAPQMNEVISFIYVITSGALANNSRSGDLVTVNNYNLTGVTTSIVSGGADEKSPEFYKVYGPSLAASQGNPDKRNQYAAYATSFGGVVDAKIRGQAETFPDDIRFTNALAYSILTDHEFDESTYRRFEYYMQGVTEQPKQLYRVDPVEVPIDISIIIKAKKSFMVYDDMKNEVEENIKALLIPKPGWLGRHFMLEDIASIVRGLYPNDVDYIIYNSPVTDIFVTPLEFIKVKSITVTIEQTDRR